MQNAWRDRGNGQRQERVFRFLLYLSAVSAVVWTIIVVLSFRSTVKHFYGQFIT